MAPNRPQTLITLDVSVGSDSEVGRHNRDFRSAPDSGHPAGGLGCPSSANKRSQGKLRLRSGTAWPSSLTVSDIFEIANQHFKRDRLRFLLHVCLNIPSRNLTGLSCRVKDAQNEIGRLCPPRWASRR